MTMHDSSLLAEPPAYSMPDASRPRLGNLFIQAGLLTQDQVEQIVRLQQTERLRFGEAAIQLGFATKQQVMAVLAEQFDYATALSDKTSISPLLAIAQQPFGPESEAIRRIRTAILIKTAERTQPLSVAIVSSTDGEGRSYLAASLAVAFSQANLRTALVDGCLRSADEHTMYGLVTAAMPQRPHGDAPDTPTLAAMLAGWKTPDTQPVPGFPRLSVVPAGPRPPNPLELLAPPKLRQLLGQIKTNHDIIVVDTPPAQESSDALAIAGQTDICVLLARKDTTSLKNLRQLQSSLLGIRATVIGAVYNTRTPPQPEPLHWLSRWWRKKD